MMQDNSFDPKIFREIVQNHPLWKHEFLTRCQSGQLIPEEVRALSTQMYKFCKKFNRILIGIMHRCQDEAARVALAENLFEELGGGEPERTHPAIFRRFTRALGIDDDTLEATATEPETAAMIDTYFEMANRYGYLAALSGVCYASEGIVSNLYSILQQGILATSSVPEKALEFFHLHIHLDDGHAEKFAQVIESHITETEEFPVVIRAILDGLDARVRFLDGILRQAREVSELSAIPTVA